MANLARAEAECAAEASAEMFRIVEAPLVGDVGDALGEMRIQKSFSDANQAAELDITRNSTEAFE
jgi:hypothetical protein